MKHRFYILDDSFCPIPGKSYKDLTPKQIEAIYKNFTYLRTEIQEEEPNYNEAKINLPEMTQRKLWKCDLQGDTLIRKYIKVPKLFKDIFKKLMSGDEQLNHN